MPVYQYHCHACGKNFERICRVEQRDYASCPDCCAKASRTLSVFSFKFKQIGKVRVNGEEVYTG